LPPKRRTNHQQPQQRHATISLLVTIICVKSVDCTFPKLTVSTAGGCGDFESQVKYLVNDYGLEGAIKTIAGAING
jgi:hypothetical protein